MDISNISNYTDYYTSMANDSVAKKLSDKLANFDESEDKELMDVCKQFESYFLEQVFKNMDKTVIKADEGDKSTSTLVDYFKEQSIAELATQSTEQNSLGIAKMLYDQMRVNLGITAEKLSENAAESGAVTTEE